MRLTVVTIFPELFSAFANTSIVGRARERGIVQIDVVDLRDHTHDRHRTVDDLPYGGGAGMVMKPQPFFECVDALQARGRSRVILMSARGRIHDQAQAARLAREESLVFLCGHYKGIDERVARLADEEISVGDYVLSGGEIPAMAVMDSVVRLLPGAVGDLESVRGDSHFEGLLSPPEYTRPEVYREVRVPQILLSGHHAKIGEWRHAEAIRITRERRPDLLLQHVKREMERTDAPGSANQGANP